MATKPYPQINIGIKKTGFITCIWYQGEELPGLHCKSTNNMNYNKLYFEKVFSTKRMERYFKLHEDENRAIMHYCCNIELAESFYPCLSVFAVALLYKPFALTETFTTFAIKYENSISLETEESYWNRRHLVECVLAFIEVSNRENSKFYQ